MPEDGVQEGGGVVVTALVEGVARSVLLVRSGGELRAFLDVCPHARWPLERFDGRVLFTPDGLLMCAAHGAVFDPATGACRGGPGQGQGLTALDIALLQPAPPAAS